MKKNQALIVLLTITLFSCNFSKGVKKDLSNGLSTSWNGFAVEDVYLTVDGKRLSNNKISLGKEVLIVANGVENFKEKDGKVYPGCSILLTDKAGKEILNLADAFADMKDGVAADKANALTATLNTGNPMIVGETYHLKTRFFDKMKAENEIVSTIDIVMSE
jgi:predicted small secreted protein